MKIPTKVKIGGVIYKVNIEDDWLGRDGADGQCFYDGPHGNAIFIGKDLSKEAREATFIHEALHAMNSTINHEFLDSFAEQIYAFLVDNNLLK